MKALFASLVVLSIGLIAHADDENVITAPHCDFVKQHDGCDYGDTLKYDGSYWTAKNCDNPCVRHGKISTSNCVNTEGFCLPPGVTPQDLLNNTDSAGQPDPLYCGPWFATNSRCDDGQSQWSRQWECVIKTPVFDQFKACMPDDQTPPADH